MTHETPESPSTDHERPTPHNPTGSPFPDPSAPKPAPDVEVIPGQPVPTPGLAENKD